MSRENYIIQINEGNKPFNAYMVLPLSLFIKMNKLLKDEILQGLVGSDQEDRLILHLLLDISKIKKVKRILSTLEKKANLVATH
ncbi:MAG TPA: hypothetical protein VGO09_03705 [Flavisolibacter sp.]|jgi:hypothetical protein|nr:hypothetical protein [Flavisolibacter sp.]